MLKWLADVLFLATITFVGYTICLAVNRKPMGQMVLFVSMMLFLLATVQDLTPTIRKAQEKAQSIEKRVDSMQKSIDNLNSKVEGAGKIFQWGIPNR